MNKLIKTGRIFYAIAMAAVGFQQFFYSDFHPIILPPLHSWIPWVAFWASLTGAGLIAAGAAIIFEVRARTVSLILGGVLLAIFCFYYIPYEIIVNPYYKHLGVWGDAEKELALSGGAFVVAGSFPKEDVSDQNSFFLTGLLRKLIPLGSIFFLITMVSFGIDHLLYTKGIAVLVPAWIGNEIFWTRFAAVALISSGIAIVLKIKLNVIAILLGTMIFIWLIILHIPRAIGQPFLNMGNEVTSAFSALAFSGIAFVIAGGSKKHSLAYDTTNTMKRIYSIDFTRGLVMIIMALDHVRDMMHVNSVTQSPTNLSTTTPMLFFTRWITYLCAPIFVFLAGTSAYISFKNKNNIAESRKFLLKRGLWLVLLEFTLVNFGLFFDLGFHTFIFEVIATIGFGFVILSLLLKSSLKTIGITGLIIIFCHNLISLIPLPDGSIIKTILSVLFGLKAFPVTSHTVFIMAYPPLPWLGIMLVGFASGKFFELPEKERKRLFVKIGLGALLLFIVIRFINIYGDPVQWSAQKNALYTFLSFMNITKYPPSLLFCLITLGIMFLIFAFAEQAKGKFMKFTSVYGKVPLFYFLVHFYLIHFVMLTIMFIQGFTWAQLDFASGTFGRPKGVESGIALWVVYIIWISVVLILYKPCLWYGRYKATSKKWWLKYI